jgi:hypothetical protein
MKDLLICILTSRDEILLEQSYLSCVNQLENTLTYDIHIIVNTKNPNYINDIKNIIKNVPIIETESNGRPGKGHNSVLAYYKTKRDEYKYVFMLDGDDFLYPYALMSVGYLLKQNPDIIHIQANDKLNDKPSVGAAMCAYNHTLNTFHFITGNLWHKHFAPNIFKKHINQGGTMSRGIIYAGRIFDTIDTHLYDEEVLLHDDYICVLLCHQYAVFKMLNVIWTSTSHIYLYNNANENNTTSHVSTDYNYDQEIMMKKYKGKFPNLEQQDNWNFEYLPCIDVPKPPKQTIEFKIGFCNKILHEIMIRYENKMIDYSNAKKYDEADKLYIKLKRAGIRNFQYYKIKSFIYTAHNDAINAKKYNDKAEKYKQIIIISRDDMQNFVSIEKINGLDNMENQEIHTKIEKPTEEIKVANITKQLDQKLRKKKKHKNITEEKPIVTITEEKPILTITEEKPILTISEEKPILTITEEKPIVTITEEKPIVTITEEKPIVTITEEKPILTITEENKTYLQPFNHTNYEPIFRLNDKPTYANIGEKRISRDDENEMIELMGNFMTYKICMY